MSFGWAYVDCADSGGGQAAGPTGSIQFLTGANATSGSESFLYHTSAYGGYAASTLVLTGTFVLSGTLSASHYHIENVTEIDASGSTFFGNTDDDIHARTGSLYIKNEAGNTNLEVGTGGKTSVRGFVTEYLAITASVYTASLPLHTLGVQQTGQVNIQLPGAGAAGIGAGYTILVKDEMTSSRGGHNITLNAGGSTLIDGSSTYILTGTMPAISLYSNGTNWFVF